MDGKLNCQGGLILGGWEIESSVGGGVILGGWEIQLSVGGGGF